MPVFDMTVKPTKQRHQTNPHAGVQMGVRHGESRFQKIFEKMLAEGRPLSHGVRAAHGVVTLTTEVLPVSPDFKKSARAAARLVARKGLSTGKQIKNAKLIGVENHAEKVLESGKLESYKAKMVLFIKFPNLKQKYGGPASVNPRLYGFAGKGELVVPLVLGQNKLGSSTLGGGYFANGGRMRSYEPPLMPIGTGEKRVPLNLRMPIMRDDDPELLELLKGIKKDTVIGLKIIEFRNLIDPLAKQEYVDLKTSIDRKDLDVIAALNALFEVSSPKQVIENRLLEDDSPALRIVLDRLERFGTEGIRGGESRAATKGS